MELRRSLRNVHKSSQRQKISILESLVDRRSSRNVHKSSRKQKINTLESLDRISALPDSLLSVILSFLPTKNTLATSILSKRWKLVWRMVHSLHFCLEVLGGRLEEQLEDENKKFVGFVNHVLLHHDAGVLKKFSLEWTASLKWTRIESDVSSWIKTAITKNVHELSLTLGCWFVKLDMTILHMTKSIFCCDSLRSLKVEAQICLSPETVFCLPKLEVLDLSEVSFQSDEVLEKMIRGCPILNALLLNMECDDNGFRLTISSTSLRRLKLNLGAYKHLQLETPLLEHLELYGFNSSVNFVQKKLTSLVKANFGITLDYEGVIPEDGFYDSVVDAVSALDCAKILTLSNDVMRALSRATMNLSTDFKRLVKLETTAYCCHWRPLQDFIQSADNLEVLTMNKSVDGRNHDHSNWTTPVEVPRCLSTSLKKVVFEGYDGHEDEREMIRYILQHGSVLEVMWISCRRPKNSCKCELVQKICEFRRKSPVCEVKFFEQEET